MIRNIFLLNIRLFLSLFISFISTGILVTNTLDSQYASFVFYSSVFSLGMSFPNSLSSVAQKFLIEKKESYLPLIVIFVVLSAALTIVLICIKLIFFERSSSFIDLLFTLMLASNFLQVISALFTAHIFVTADVYILARVGILDAVIKGSFIVFYRHVENILIFWVLLLLLSSFTSFLYYFVYFRKSIPKKLKYSGVLIKEILNYWRWFILGSFVKNLRSNGLVFAMRMSSYGDKLLVAYGLYKQLENGTKKIGATINSIARPRLIKINLSGDIVKLSIVFRKVVVASLVVIIMPYLGITIFVNEFILAWIGDIPEYSIVFIRYGLLLIFVESLFVHLMNLVYFDKSPKKFQLYGSYTTLIFLLTLVPIGYFDLRPLYYVWVPVVFAFIGLVMRFFAIPKNRRNMSLIQSVFLDVAGCFLFVLVSAFGLREFSFFYKCTVLGILITILILFYNCTLFKLNKKSLHGLFTS